ncbi:hypothetical protein [Sinomonas halotolerans]|uniref:MarR family transcriptional regulator n=1 Tax=Sinomonas halotolerans TaxID=1644133 RepID=A0ABU9WX56_9MICC
MYTVTINQRDRQAGDRVPALLKALARLHPEVPFDRTVGDEAQAVFTQPGPAVEAALAALRPDACGNVRWNVGIGVGPLEEPLPLGVSEARGAALVYSRRAVERAQLSGEAPAIAVDGAEPSLAHDAEGVLRLIGLAVTKRTVAEWRVLDLLTPGVRGQQKAVAEALGITAQAVSKAIARAHWNEEWAARPAAVRLLALLNAAPGGPGR